MNRPGTAGSTGCGRLGEAMETAVPAVVERPEVRRAVGDGENETE